jgi:hypothetical protein
VVKVPKSGGCVTRGREEDKLLRDLSIKEYFLGTDGKLTPSLQQLKVSDVKVYKATGGIGAQAGLLPASMASGMDPTRLTPVPITEELVCTYMTLLNVLREGLHITCFSILPLTACIPILERDCGCISLCAQQFCQIFWCNLSRFLLHLKTTKAVLQVSKT